MSTISSKQSHIIDSFFDYTLSSRDDAAFAKLREELFEFLTDDPKSGLPLPLWVIKSRELRVLELLVELKVDLDTADPDGNTALHLTSTDESLLELTKFLLGNGAKLQANQDGVTPLHLAMQHENLSTLTVLVEHFSEEECYKSDAKGKNVLHYLAASEAPEFLDLLLLVEKRLDPFVYEDGDGRTPISEAMRLDNRQFVTRVLLRAINRRNLPQVKQILPYALSKDLKLPLALLAVKSGDLDILRFMQESGVDLDSADYGGTTALHAAVSDEDLQPFVELLVEHGARLLPDSNGVTPLHIAVSEENIKATRSILQHTSRETWQIRDGRGESALHCLVEVDSKELYDLMLLEHNIDSFFITELEGGGAAADFETRTPIAKAIDDGNELFIAAAFLQQARYGNVEKAQQLFVHIREIVEAEVRKTEADRDLVVDDVDSSLASDGGEGETDEDEYVTADDRSYTTDDGYETARSSAASDDDLDAGHSGSDGDDDLDEEDGWEIYEYRGGSYAKRFDRALHARVKNAVLVAVQYGQIAMLRWFVRSASEGGVGISLSYYSDIFSYLSYSYMYEAREPLAISVRYGQIATLRWLLSSPDSEGGGGGLSFSSFRSVNIVFLAVRYGQISMLRWLLQNPDAEGGGGGFSLDVCGLYRNRPLFVALEYGQLPMLQWLLQDPGADGYGGGLTLDDFDEGKSPILEAAFYGHIPMLRWLKDHMGLSLDVRDERELNPVLKAVQGGKIPMLRWLLQDPGSEDGGGGLSLDVTNDYAENPVLVAVAAGQIKMLRWLLQDPTSAEGGGGLSLDVKAANGEDPVLIATAYGQLPMLRWLLQDPSSEDGGGGLTLDVNDNRGRTPVLYAACMGEIRILRWLLQDPASEEGGGGLSLDITDNYLWGPVLQAVVGGCLHMLCWLLQDPCHEDGGGGLSLDLIDYKSYGPLELAIQHGEISILSWLLQDPDHEEGGGGLTFKSRRSKEPLCLAIRYGQLETLEWLVRDSDSADGGGGLAANLSYPHVSSAIQYGRIEILRWLITEGGLSLRLVRNPIFVVIQAGQLEMLKWLVQSTADGGGGLSLDVTDKSGVNPVLEAARCGQLAILKWLVKPRGAAGEGGGLSLQVTDNCGYNPVLVAVQHNQLSILKWLLQNPASDDGGGGLTLNVTDAKNKNPVLIAVAAGHLDMLKWLITPKAQGGGGLSLNVRDKFGHNPVLEAIFSGQLEMLKWLVRMPGAAGDGGGQSLSVETNWGANPVIMAAHYGKLDILKWLVQDPSCEDGGGGLSLNVTGKEGRNPVLSAVAKGHIETVKWLIQPSASEGGGGNLSLNVSDKYTKNPVLIAASSGQLRMLKWLVKSREEGGGGLSVAVRTRYGFDAIILAAISNKINVLRWLVADAPDGGGMAVDTQARSGKTAIQYAQEKGHLDVLEFLFTRGLEQITEQRDIEAVLDWGRENLNLDVARLKPLLVAFIQKSLTALLEAKQLDIVRRVYEKYVAVDGDNATMVMADFYQRHGYYSRSYDLYHQLWNGESELKEEAVFHIANLIWLGYIDVHVEDSPFEPGLAGEHTYSVDEDRKREILTARAIQAYYFIGESPGSRNQEFKERLDQILAGNYSPGIFESAEWSERSKRLFQHFHMAMAPDFVGRKQMLEMFKRM